ncbi:uncharacterized protein LOC129753978 [Uranotaenia lowii]|uniref:uncharacterized protein LOC129753978 n=1 Tax=Uranotaenia lowii TaxID=190385 RepID=UPI00247A0BA1|nr:uncharacterized protein LOC129753978 [Uranotaenia lowii]
MTNRYLSLISMVVLVFAPSWKGGVQGSITAYYKAASDCVKFLGICESRLDQYNQFSFPPDRDTMCFVRCVGLVFDVWNDQNGTNWCGLEYKLDPLSEQQTKQCIQHKMAIIDPLDVCARAYYSLRCFRGHIRDILAGHSTMSYDHHALAPFGDSAPAAGHVSSSCGCSSCTSGTGTCTGSFTPLPVCQLIDALDTCIGICGFQSLNFCSDDGEIFPDCPAAHCTIQCALKRTKVYSDQKGILVDNLYTQLGRCETYESFRGRLENCFRRRRQPPGTCAEAVAFRQYFTCVQPDYARFFAGNYAELANVQSFKKYCY